MSVHATMVYRTLTVAVYLFCCLFLFYFIKSHPHTFGSSTHSIVQFARCRFVVRALPFYWLRKSCCFWPYRDTVRGPRKKTMTLKSNNNNNNINDGIFSCIVDANRQIIRDYIRIHTQSNTTYTHPHCQGMFIYISKCRFTRYGIKNNKWN